MTATRRPRSPEEAELEEIRTTESLIHYFEQERCQKCGWVRDMVVPGCRCKTAVTIRRSPWDSGSSVDILVDDLWHFHMRDRAGGVAKRNPGGRQFLYARMSCADLPEDSYFGHSCMHGRAPHEILVCICKCDNPDIYESLKHLIESEVTS